MKQKKERKPPGNWWRHMRHDQLLVLHVEEMEVRDGHNECGDINPEEAEEWTRRQRELRSN